MWRASELRYVIAFWDKAGAYHTEWLYEVVVSHYESRKYLELFGTFQIGMTFRASSKTSQAYQMLDYKTEGFKCYI